MVVRGLDHFWFSRWDRSQMKAAQSSCNQKYQCCFGCPDIMQWRRMRKWREWDPKTPWPRTHSKLGCTHAWREKRKKGGAQVLIRKEDPTSCSEHNLPHKSRNSQEIQPGYLQRKVSGSSRRKLLMLFICINSSSSAVLLNISRPYIPSLRIEDNITYFKRSNENLTAGYWWYSTMPGT